jgi:hypothetical protein
MRCVPPDGTRRSRGVRARTLALLLLLGAPPTAAQRVLPVVLHVDAMERGCAPVTDTTAFPGLTLPLFRFGVYEAGKDTLRRVSGAYWCIMPDANQGTALVIWRDWGGGAPVPGGCASVIRYRGMPGGLRFEQRAVMQLRDAHLVEDPGRRGPRVTAKGTVIVAEYGGVTARFLCHTGRWYVALGTSGAPP